MRNRPCGAVARAKFDVAAMRAHHREETGGKHIGRGLVYEGPTRYGYGDRSRIRSGESPPKIDSNRAAILYGCRQTKGTPPEYGRLQ